MGQVIQSFHHTSVVRLITDGESKVGVTFAGQLTGIVDGQGPSSSMTADLVAPLHTVAQGRGHVHEQSRRGRVPPGIPVASVRSFHTSAGASQESIKVDPTADLSQLAYVDVVQWVPST